jgi:hypothetical protein
MQEAHIDYNAIVAQKTLDERLAALRREVARCEYVCLTDAIAYYDFGGAMMFLYLADDEINNMREGKQRRWKIQVVRDEWGNPPVPGEFVERRIQKKPVDAAGRKLKSRAINDAKRRGTWERDFVEIRRFEIDDRGCIECSYDDAGWFLSEFGMHYDQSGVAICGRKEISGGPCKAPDGKQKHIWYWRYQEAPPWVYEKLPLITGDKPHRGKRASVDSKEK